MKNSGTKYHIIGMVFDIHCAVCVHTCTVDAVNNVINVLAVVVKVSNGALDMAKTNMELLLCHCAKPLSLADVELTTSQSKSVFDTVHELVRHVTSPNTVVRDQVYFVVSFSGRF